MITVKDYIKYTKNADSALQEKVDEWLKTVVFPHHYDKAGYECPSWIDLVNLQMLLQQRGWEVTVYSGYAGSFVYLSVPPQQDD